MTIKLCFVSGMFVGVFDASWGEGKRGAILYGLSMMAVWILGFIRVFELQIDLIRGWILLPMLASLLALNGVLYMGFKKQKRWIGVLSISLLCLSVLLMKLKVF